MQWIGNDTTAATGNRKKIEAQKKAEEQLKWRVPSIDRANQVVEKYYKVHADKLIIKGS